jgi:myosin heavy subunit
MLLAELFKPKEEVKSLIQKKQEFGMGGRKNTATGGGLIGKSLSCQFKSQLVELLDVLRESSPRYVRCIKPNSVMSSSFFESFEVCK